ncbi:P-loop containing nucleoside triphosphate hydrolase protein [Flagelloscypha sp. PMI_526]|nr:P-loop containing nucleoside triphosphate hydrolase protein [Flagelloscypha sp. PMI_526]
MHNAPTVWHTIKCGLFGSENSGKTSLAIRASLGIYVSDWDPTIEDTYAIRVPHQDGKVISFQVDDFCSSEPWLNMGYCVKNCFNSRKPPVVILCFSVVDPSSFKAVADHWHPEIMKWGPKAKILLVGTKSDLLLSETNLEELRLRHLSPIQREQGHALAKYIGAYAYVECSAKEDRGMQELREALLEGGRAVIPQEPGIPQTLLKENRRQKRKSNCRLM